MPTAQFASNPRVGLVATVRNRRGIISEVSPFSGDAGELHLVHIEYKDDHAPADERLIWELEPCAHVVEPNELPRVQADPMPAADFDALVRSARWSAISPYLDPDGDGPLERLPIPSPFHGAVEVEDYQLVPLLKALQMPRVSLLIADDVGLGKTVEAGLILSELLLRRRIDRVLILTPAALRLQWRDEMWDKFALPFDVIDRRQTHQLRRQLGIDANPWRACSRIIASYHYLRQPDVLEQFQAACSVTENDARLPWDLLIVDEAHNLMPSPFGQDSDLCNTLRLVAPHFEHRLFLTATPHNGHTRCFTGLLEILDPVRFSQVDQLGDAMKKRLDQIVIRRLKREINERTNPPRFCTRLPPQSVVLNMNAREIAVTNAFGLFRKRVRSLIQAGERGRRQAGTFAVAILGKRLLSCPMTFAESWRRCKLGLAEQDAATDGDVAAAQRTIDDDPADDREAQSREAAASTVVGAWMKAFVDDLGDEIEMIDHALTGLGFDLSDAAVELPDQTPKADSRFDALTALIDERLRDGDAWKSDERLIIFTEYKTTLDYLLRRLRAKYDDNALITLFGGMDDVRREQVKDAFNDPTTDVRILIGTDAAAEGLNLQRTARYMLHYDCPWNPSRLEQRNGRLDRHGQPRDVTIFHFMSDQDDDLRFLDHVIRKVDQIREDLGSTGELFDEAAHRRLIDGEDRETVVADLDRLIFDAADRASFEADGETSITQNGETPASANLRAIAAEIDLDPIAMRDTLETAMALNASRPQLNAVDAHCHEILRPDLPGWKDVIDESARRRAASGVTGPLTRLAFSADPFIEDIGGRTVFSPRPDTQMMHLAHPMMRKALGALTRRRFPGQDAVSRWTIRTGPISAGADALILLTLEEIAVNELRETYHHWIRTIMWPVVGEDLGDPLPHAAPATLHDAAPTSDPTLIDRGRDIIDTLEPDLRHHIRTMAATLTEELRQRLETEREAAIKETQERYQSRQGEVSALIEGQTIEATERRIKELLREKEQGRLAFAKEDLQKVETSIERMREELKRQVIQYEDVRKHLNAERDRILKHLIPRRFSMHGDAQVFPVAIEIRFPGGEV